MSFHQPGFVPKNVVERGVSRISLGYIVDVGAVVVENRGARDGEDRQRDDGGMAR